MEGLIPVPHAKGRHMPLQNAVPMCRPLPIFLLLCQSAPIRECAAAEAWCVHTVTSGADQGEQFLRFLLTEGAVPARLDIQADDGLRIGLAQVKAPVRVLHDVADY